MVFLRGFMSKVNLLFSYAFAREDPLFECMISAFSDMTDVFIDSGAFTAWKTGHQIRLEDYMKFCHKYKDKAWGYIQLDVIKDSVGTAKNLDIMYQEGLKPVPVLQVCDPAERCVDLIKYNKKIAISGGAIDGVRINDIIDKFNEAYKLTNGEIKIHGLGYTRVSNLFDLPLASVDSSTYMAGTRYGRFMRLINGKINSINFAGMKAQTSWFDEECVRFMSRCGITMKDINTKKFRQGLDSFMSLAGVFAYLKLIKYSEERGKKFFLCILTYDNLVAIASVLSTMSDDCFNFNMARKRFKILNDTHKKDKLKFIKIMRNALSGEIK
jgi:hypothetical protein